MTNENIQSVEFFLKNSNQYWVLHESSPSNPNLEHYFISITVLDIKNKQGEEDKILKQYILNYQNKYPLVDIAEKSHNYIAKEKNNYFFLFIDTLDKKDRFFLQKEEFLKNNIGNILSLRMLGKAVNLSGYIDNQAQKYLSQFADISQTVAGVLKKEAKTGIDNGLKALNDKAPVIKKKLEILKKIIKPK
jgi:hypothetical protein